MRRSPGSSVAMSRRWLICSARSCGCVSGRGWSSLARPDRLLLAADRLQSDLEVERRANAAYEHYRATARDRLGRRLSRGPNPYEPPQVPAGRVNITDPDSKPLPISFGFAQGYNAQAAVNEERIVPAAETTNPSTDFSQL